MSVAYCNLKGEKIGKLTPIELVDDFESNKTTKKWKCQCECGNFVNYSSRVLNEAKKTKRNISCGCFYGMEHIGKVYGDYLIIKYCKELKDKGRYHIGKCIKCGEEVILSSRQLYKHKMCQSCHKKEAKTIKKLKQKLSRIKRRCYDEKDKAYVNYGARGITVCDKWKNDFMSFYNWSMQNGYKENLTIDRINNDGNYEPSNCRWVDRKIQNNNTRANHLLTYNGKTLNISQWANLYNLSYSCLKTRIRNGWSIEKALTTPTRK